MRYKKTFSLLEFYEELNFIELEELYTLWKLFPKQSVSYQFELFFSFKKAHQEKYNCVLDVLRKKLSNSFAIFSEILLEYHNYKKFCEISNIKETHKVSLDSMFYRLQIDSLQKQIYSHIDELISYYRGVYKTLSVSTGLFKDYSESDYLESSLIILLFDLLSNYKNVRNKFSFNLKNNTFINFYKNKGIDLLKEDKQYEKYGLLSISLDNFEFCTNQPFQLKDKRIDSTLYFNDLIPNNTSMNKNNHLSLKDYLWESLQMKKISQLSLLPEFNDVPSDGLTLCLENFEKGNSFKINGLNKENIAKLFQEREYSNQLWAYMDGESDITFEEFNEEETKDYLDICGFYVTNVVHLKYFKDGDDYFIEHLDHEYVFYSPDEYKKRKLNHLQKGNAKKRIKTFKIDNSKIPLTSESGLEFLEFILKECLKHTDLIEEFLYS
ncbi:hypothetical protein [Neisseria lactamica]|uniref:hypothetical protein n=1 Tax=Neisseria lactamica TaxID=486 RepID=UPI0002F6F45E|nr:hypothetical protein [Neisseria lactamica]